MTTAVIDKMRYDTNSAEEICRWGNGLSAGDFHSVDETLYRTPNGRWFLECEGGALTGYARKCGDMFSSGSVIRPCESEEVLEWLETHRFVEEIEQYFADKITDA